ncbi:rho GTPase-activating protein 12 isoform X1 [Bombina bombina]|uniref:rho GTPase-activating protein 12 isoform X1 n=1 Tax=Bombina bombina TaxID=8345 RepID=UPI00235AC7C2|nr:rho GTPase-activating protein 12 isoform X1 [Bombina bombina]XP_053569837.1 rho GTPase-activating protein 12 isoform X1 [Bombina bombina]XP_053569838.1 rho GTPase-activating protein 12 isoform X1 [Bombina bombina]
MADKSVKPAPGPVFIEVEYDYEYEYKNKKIVIKQGEKYILLKKSNEDWWQVKKDENAKPLYVPAQYVKEVARKALMPPIKQQSVLPNSPLKVMQGLQRSTENVNKSPELTSFGKSSSSQVSGLVRDANQNIGPSNSPGQTRGLTLDIVQNNGKLNSDLHSPKASNRSPSAIHFPCPELMEIEKNSFSNEQSGDSAGESSEKIPLDSESGDELSSSSTEQLQFSSTSAPARPDSPVYANLQELKISQSSLPPQPCTPPIHIIGEWETHKDNSGRSYYFNKNTQERTWKPPRGTKESFTSKGESYSPADQEPFSSEDNYHSTCDNQSDSQFGSPPRGWSEELDQHGHTLYINDQTNEKWMKHIDEQGRPYYYNADGSRSEWELPKYNALLHPQREITKSRSLDRKFQENIVLTKWRHSTYLLETDKESPTPSKANFPDNEASPPSPKLQSTDQEKYGVLNVTKITENGKKVRKNWTSSWTVLQGTSLLLQGTGAGWKFGNQSKPEFTVDLKGASVDWATKDKSSKKNVLELKTHTGTELLIQSDNDTVIKDWYTALSNTIGTPTGESDEASEDHVPDSPVEKHGKEKNDKEKDHDNRDSKKNRSIKPGSSIDNSEQKKTKTKLKKFLTRRPTMQAVREKGYIKDPVFGSSLASLCQRENTTVPNFVKLCIDHVEEHGLDIDGLYRVSGNLAVIQKLRFAVTHDEKLDLNDCKWEDIHVIAGALKMFFRELPEPLFTFNHFDDFVLAIQKEPRLRVQAVRDLIKQLPKPNQDTMQALFKHLKHVVETGEKNRMTYQSLAIVFGPTLLKPEKETGNIAVHTVYQNQIVELILLEYNAIFGR